MLHSNATTGNDITFSSTVQGAQILTLNSGVGDITFGDDVGTSGTSLTSLQIVDPADVTAYGAIYASAITQSAGTGTSTFDGLVSTNNTNGVNLTGNAFTFNGGITTTNNGPVVINNSGALTTSSGSYSISGALTQNGTGSNNIAGTFTVGGAILFTEAITLIGDTTFDTSSMGRNHHLFEHHQ